MEPKESNIGDLDRKSPLDFQYIDRETQESKEEEETTEVIDKQINAIKDSTTIVPEIVEDDDQQDNLGEIPPVNFANHFPKLVQTLQLEQKKYKDTYKPIPYEDKDNSKSYFFLSLKAYDLIVKELPNVRKKFLEIFNKNSEENIIEIWKQGIESILFKALVAESVKYGQWIAEDISKRHENQSNLEILELCTGAGITTSMIYLERLNTGKKTRIISVDNSIESIACASLLASSFGINTEICTSGSLQMVPKNFDGIIFVIKDAVEFVEKDLKENQFDITVSDNGISYFPNETHKEILQQLKTKLPKGDIYISSLKKGKSVNLGLPFEISGILKGSNFRIRDTKDQYVVKDGVIKETYTPETASFFTLANKMLKRSGRGGFKDLTKLLSILSSATKSSQDLNGEIQTTVQETKDIGKEIGLNFDIPYPENNLAPCEVGVFRSK